MSHTYNSESRILTVTVDTDELKKSGSTIEHLDFRTSSNGKTYAGLAVNGMISLTEEEKKTGVITEELAADSNAKNYKVYFKNKYGI